MVLFSEDIIAVTDTVREQLQHMVHIITTGLLNVQVAVIEQAWNGSIVLQ